MPLKYTILPAISIFTNVAPVGAPYETNRDEHFLKIRIKIIHLEEPQQWVTALSAYLSSQSTPWSRWKQCFQRSPHNKSKGVRSKVIKHSAHFRGCAKPAYETKATRTSCGYEKTDTGVRSIFCHDRGTFFVTQVCSSANSNGYLHNASSGSIEQLQIWARGFICFGARSPKKSHSKVRRQYA